MHDLYERTDLRSPYFTKVDLPSICTVTKQLPLSYTDQSSQEHLDCTRLLNLYIIYDANPSQNVCYLTHDNTELLLLNAPKDIALSILSHCGDQLHHLTLSLNKHFDTPIFVSHLHGLRELVLRRVPSQTIPPDINRLHNLVKLSVFLCTGKIKMILSGLKNLETLHLNLLPDELHLESIDNLHALRELIIEHCHLDPVWNLTLLKNLEKLIIRTNFGLHRLFGVEHLTQLRELRIQDCPNVLNVRKLRKLTILDLSYNWKLKEIPGISSLKHLEYLDISGTSFAGKLDLRSANALQTLNVFKTELTHLQLALPLPSLTSINLSFTLIQDFDFLKHLPNLERLNLSCCSLEAFGALPTLPKLQLLDLSGAHLSESILSNVPPNLEILDLSHSHITYVPANIQNLHNLKRIVLENLELKDIPNWLPILRLPIYITRTPENMLFDGISLYGTTIEGVDMAAVFEQPQEMILQWFRNRAKGLGRELNEAKIIFLGDGEAGKTHTIARLLNDGAPVDFHEDATPGIIIEDKTYDLDGRNVQVHYWDFGGQEILHSMHRIFLTGRTPLKLQEGLFGCDRHSGTLLFFTVSIIFSFTAKVKRFFPLGAKLWHKMQSKIPFRHCISCPKGV